MEIIDYFFIQAKKNIPFALLNAIINSFQKSLKFALSITFEVEEIYIFWKHLELYGTRILKQNVSKLKIDGLYKMKQCNMYYNVIKIFVSFTTPFFSQYIYSKLHYSSNLRKR